MSALTSYSPPTHVDLAQWLERQLEDGVTCVVLRQKAQNGAENLVREFAIDDTSGGATVLANTIHARAADDGRHFPGKSLYGVFAFRDGTYVDRLFFSVEGEEDEQRFGMRDAKSVGGSNRISRNAHKIAFCKLLRARLNEPPPLHRLLSACLRQARRVFGLLAAVLAALIGAFRPRAQLVAETLALRSSSPCSVERSQGRALFRWTAREQLRKTIRSILPRAELRSASAMECRHFASMEK